MTLKHAIENGIITKREAYECIMEIDDAIRCNETTEDVKRIFDKYITK